MKSDKERGLYQKYITGRVDGQDRPGKKHAKCKLFVLDIDHDEHAIPALKAYIESCRKDYSLLAQDLEEKIKEKENR